MSADDTILGLQLDPAKPTPIDAFGARQIVILGTWNDGQAIIERRLPPHAGDPLEGSWTGCPSRDADGVTHPAAPFDRDETRIVMLFNPPHRVRVVPAPGKPAPALTMAIGDPVEG